MSDSTPREGLDRRRFLQVLGVTGAGAAVVSGCSTQKVEKLIPYLVQSEDQVPGLSTWYASTCTECSAGCGLHVRTREGRAIKLEGNPEHPVNAGKLCAHGQSALQGLYNPDRLTGPKARQADGSFKDITWDDAIALLVQKLQGAGGKLAVINGANRGTFSDLLAAWTAAQGGKVVAYQPFSAEPIRQASQQVFGLNEVPVYDFARAKYIVSFGADFLDGAWVSPVETQLGFAEAHGYKNGEMAKHVSFSPRMGLTGMNADEWLAPRPGSEAAIVLAMANVLLSERSGNPADANGLRGALAGFTPEKAQEASGINAEVIKRVAREFASASPSLAVAGGIPAQHRGAAELCAAVNLLNYIAGNVGTTVRYGADQDAGGDGYAALLAVVEGFAGGATSVVLVHEANPAYAMPKKADFAGKFAKVPFKVSTSLYLDETAALCDLLLPNLHALERWDDARSRKGVSNLLQPVMEPVFPGMATGDLLLKTAQKLDGPLAAFSAPSYEAHLKAQWLKAVGSEDAWRAALAKGGVYGDAPAAPVKLAAGAASAVAFSAPAFDGPEGEDAFWLMPSPSVLGDGRFANRPWMLELPDPVTRITWHAWVEIHPDTAKEMNVREGEILRLESPHGTIEAPAYVFPGIHPRVVSVPMGFGHTSFGRFATGSGVNVLDLVDGAATGSFLPYFGTRVKVVKTMNWKKVAKTEGTTRQLGRGIVNWLTLDQAKRGLTPLEALAEEGHGEHEVNTEREVEAIKGFDEAQREKRKHGAYANENPMWGMVIDLGRCTGCSACVTACYAENNIPFVGESEVLRGREMSWMRIERYWEGGEEGEPLQARVLPMLCQHCDNAPCEPVCPVYAAYHTPDGLNGQVYNRCVGTRYCGNNCPYKVRYFNWLAYNKKAFPAPLNLQLNPDVTVRARGVMEKCTFCVQRIRGAQHQARLEDRKLRDGDVVTACAQACPSGAITFGDMTDPEARVTKAGADPRGYHVLDLLNVRPAVTYLAKVVHRTEA